MSCCLPTEKISWKETTISCFTRIYIVYPYRFIIIIKNMSPAAVLLQVGEDILLKNDSPQFTFLFVFNMIFSIPFLFYWLSLQCLRKSETFFVFFNDSDYEKKELIKKPINPVPFGQMTRTNWAEMTCARRPTNYTGMRCLQVEHIRIYNHRANHLEFQNVVSCFLFSLVMSKGQEWETFFYLAECYHHMVTPQKW